MSSLNLFFFKFVIFFVILTVVSSEISKFSKKLVVVNNSTKLAPRVVYHVQKATRNGVTAASKALEQRYMKRSPLSESNVEQPMDDNNVDDLAPSVSLSIDPALQSSLANAGDSENAELFRKDLMKKVLDSAMSKLRELVINKGGNASSIPTLKSEATTISASNEATTSIISSSPKRFPTRQLPRTLPLIVRAPSTVAPTTKKIVLEDDTVESTPIPPSDESDTHSEEKVELAEKKSKKFYKVATSVKLPPIHMKSNRLDINYADEDKSASKEIINDELAKDQFWQIVEDDDDASLDDTEEQENEELLRMLEAKLKEKENESTTEASKKDLRQAAITEPPIDFRIPRPWRPEFLNFVNSIRDFFVNIYHTLGG